MYIWCSPINTCITTHHTLLFMSKMIVTHFFQLNSTPSKTITEVKIIEAKIIEAKIIEAKIKEEMSKMK